MCNENEINKMKKVVLHLHLDGSLRPETVYKWLKEQNQDVTLEQVKKDLMVEKGCRNLTEYLKKFDLPCKMLQTKDHLEQATYELFEDLANQNVIYAEIRFAPSKHLEQGLNYDEVVQSAIDGMNKAKRKYKIEGSLILCAMRGDSFGTNKKVVEIASKYLGKGVSSIDLAGAEAIFPTKDYKEVFDLAKDYDIPFTIHAGEAAGSESVDKALDFEAKRIGHGIASINSLKTINRIIQNEIILEICPTSNFQTLPDLKAHPIEKLYKKGVKVTLNSDNDTVSNTNIVEEYKWALENTNLNIEDLKQMNINAIDGIFGITPKKKEELKAIIQKQ